VQKTEPRPHAVLIAGYRLRHTRKSTCARLSSFAPTLHTMLLDASRTHLPKSVIWGGGGREQMPCQAQGKHITLWGMGAEARPKARERAHAMPRGTHHGGRRPGAL
jgi:hypothetical protein